MKTWAEVSARVGRNDLPHTLASNLIVLPQEEIAKGLADAWTMCEFPSSVGDDETWEMLFSIAGVDSGKYLDDEGDMQPRNLLPSTLTLYRGAHTTRIKGMSWTSDLERAKWFATRLGDKDMGVYTITVPSDLVLGKFDRRGESEYVIDTSMIFEDDIEEMMLEEAK